MSSHQLKRQNSWPPTSKPLPPTPSERQEILDSIDENPFSFFLTSPDEIDIDDYFSDDDLNAGIETPDSAHSPIREVSPSSLQRNPLPIPHFKEEFDDDIAIVDGDEDDEEFEYGFGMAIPLTLKEYTANTTPSSGRKSRTGQYLENRQQEQSNQTTGLGISLADFGTGRGRARVRLVPQRPGRGRMSRSLPVRRPSSWRAPSPEIFSIREERESDEEEKKEDGIRLRVENEVGEEIYSMSAPASSRIGPGGLASPGLKKVKKRVHWAL